MEYLNLTGIEGKVGSFNKITEVTELGLGVVLCRPGRAGGRLVDRLGFPVFKPPKPEQIYFA